MPDDIARVPNDSSLVQAARSSWLSFRETFQSLRPELYRFCRSLTRSPWDAEDLVQESLMRAFVMLGKPIRARDPGAIKAALHRGRGKLLANDLAGERNAVPQAIDAFCEAFNAGDLDGYGI